MAETHPRLAELYLAFTFDLVAREPFEHLHWGLWRGVPHETHRLPEAQARYAEAIVAQVPPGARVLDVGAGLGGIAAMLAARGHAVTALTPRADHAARLTQVAPPGLSVVTARFEDCSTTEAHDALIFSESFNFFVNSAIEIEAWQARCHALAPGGRVVVADLVTPAVSRALASQARVHEDWSDEVAFTLEALEARFAHARAYGELLLGVLGELDPALADGVAARLATVPNQALRELFAGRLVERDLLRTRRYELFVL